jgi:hypothetical protein
VSDVPFSHRLPFGHESNVLTRQLAALRAAIHDDISR